VGSLDPSSRRKLTRGRGKGGGEGEKVDNIKSTIRAESKRGYEQSAEDFCYTVNKSTVVCMVVFVVFVVFVISHHSARADISMSVVAFAFTCTLPFLMASSKQAEEGSAKGTTEVL